MPDFQKIENFPKFLVFLPKSNGKPLEPKKLKCVLIFVLDHLFILDKNTKIQRLGKSLEYREVFVIFAVQRKS